MALTPYRSRSDLFSPMLEDFFRSVGGTRAGDLLRVPDADVVERENEIQVVAELPGMKPEDIDLSLENNVLTISGEKREERKEGDEKSNWHLTERRYGRFSRSFALPSDVEQEKIEARYEEGVLTVTIPKSERARRRRIEVRGGTRGAQKEESGESTRK